jgi:glycosyltransferase involved in cell wall biosynthesis
VNLVEGLAYGKGFIACDIGEAREIHAQHGVGRMVPPGDADALANAMIDVAKRPQLVQQLSARARDAAGYFTVHATTERFVELYESLARKDQRQTA